MKLRILVVDDHALVRAGIVALVADMPAFEVVGDAGNADEALEMARKLKPDLILLDIHMPRQSGLELLPQLRLSVPQSKVLMLSMYSDMEHVKKALDLGASGYLLKDSTPEDIDLAIRSAHKGHLWLSSQLGATVGQMGLTAPDVALLEQLTPRQLEVFKRVVRGDSTKTISADLGLSVKTIETYRQQLQDRLGVSSVVDMVRLAIRAGLITL